ncbi:MAG TPA: hypothetical protein VHP30_10470, partial [Ignavibacteriales bacterium]|nr:hypothetical protein [Ignavibacteriales bacterium]
SDIHDYYIYLPKGTYKYIATITGDMTNYIINSVQRKEFEFRKYDAFGRLYDIGEYLSTGTSVFTQDNAAAPAFPSNNIVRNKYYYFDGPSPMAVASGQRNLKGRVSYASTYQDGALHQHTFYSYDDLGRVEWIVQYFATGYNAKIKYNYDLQGKLVKKEYLQTNNNMYTFYEYDQMQRLINVNTGRYENGSEKIPEASYTYNAGGTVKRLKLANAQGVDYCYNSRDWLTMINQQNLNSADDPGHDGATGSAIPVDKFGMVLGYDITNHIGGAQGTPAQYNGNISWQMYNISGLAFNSFPLVGASYTYDKANRLKKSDFGYYDGSWKPATAYDMSNISYDNNGNITLLNRYGTQNSLMDNQTYNYIATTNKLQSITDAALPSMSGSDIDNQASNNYAYDANGNLTQDLQNGVGFIYYDINNLPLKMYKTNGTVLEYGYDATGNRSYNKPENRYYINNLSGANEAVASSVTSTTVSYNIYGNDNIGLIDKIGTTYNRYYYLKDHLGSIRVRVD